MALIFHSLFVKILNAKTNLNKFKCVSSSLNFCLINFLLKTFLALSIYHQILLNSLNLHRKKIFLLNKTPEYIYIYLTVVHSTWRNDDELHIAKLCRVDWMFTVATNYPERVVGDKWTYPIQHFTGKILRQKSNRERRKNPSIVFGMNRVILICCIGKK